MDKLYAIGVINSTKKVSDIENKLSVSAFCRRRIGVVMQRLKMCETVSAGVKFVEQGHVRVGPEVITDPAYLVPRLFAEVLLLIADILKILSLGSIRARSRGTS